MIVMTIALFLRSDGWIVLFIFAPNIFRPEKHLPTVRQYECQFATREFSDPDEIIS